MSIQCQLFIELDTENLEWNFVQCRRPSLKALSQACHSSQIFHFLQLPHNLALKIQKEICIVNINYNTLHFMITLFLFTFEGVLCKVRLGICNDVLVSLSLYKYSLKAVHLTIYVYKYDPNWNNKFQMITLTGTHLIPAKV